MICSQLKVKADEVLRLFVICGYSSIPYIRHKVRSGYRQLFSFFPNNDKTKVLVLEIKLPWRSKVGDGIIRNYLGTSY